MTKMVIDFGSILLEHDRRGTSHKLVLTSRTRTYSPNNCVPVRRGMALYFKCSKTPSNLVAAVVGCFLRPGQRVLVTATLSHVSVWTSEGHKFSKVLYILTFM